MKVALVTELFVGTGAEGRLRRVVRQAGDAGAGLVVLPELVLDPWFPATRDTSAGDAEPPNGPRHRLLASVARHEGVAIVGGAVVVEPGTGRRFSTALVFDAGGTAVGSYRKMHLPNEEGFWEAAHYEPGEDLPGVIEAFAVPIGIQVCSDVNRPEGSHVLGALGAEAILAPRGTPTATYERWKLVLRANAVTSCTYVLSTNRPGPERGVDIGGPSLAIAPDGEVLIETTDPLSFVTLDRAVVARARAEYPGYLTIRSEVYARAWEAAGRRARA